MVIQGRKKSPGEQETDKGYIFYLFIIIIVLKKYIF